MQNQQKEKHDADPAIRLKDVLTKWLVSVAGFYQLYYQLSDCLDSVVPSQNASSEIIWIGQCQTHQLINLQNNMRSELEKINLEMNQTGQQLMTNRYEMLVAHSLRLATRSRTSPISLPISLLIFTHPAHEVHRQYVQPGFRTICIYSSQCLH